MREKREKEHKQQKLVTGCVIIGINKALVPIFENSRQNGCLYLWVLINVCNILVMYNSPFRHKQKYAWNAMIVHHVASGVHLGHVQRPFYSE